MIDLDEFKKAFPLDERIGDFSDKELSNLRGKIPDDLHDFLNQEQKSVYAESLIWTVLPSEYHDELSNWGIDGDNAYVFMRTSFGGLVYILKDTCYAFNPHEGSVLTIGGVADIYYLINLAITYYYTLETCFYSDIHVTRTKSLSRLKESEMYTFVPALSLGGDKLTSNIEVVKIREQLDILAQLFDHKIEEY